METNIYGKKNMCDLTPEEFCLFSIDIQLVTIFRNDAGFAIPEISQLLQGRSKMLSGLNPELTDYSFKTFCEDNGFNDCYEEFVRIKPVLKMERKMMEVITKRSKSVNPHLN